MLVWTILEHKDQDSFKQRVKIEVDSMYLGIGTKR